MTYQFAKDLENQKYYLDKEHRELLNAVNQLLDACSQGKGSAAVNSTLKFLLDYVDKHFAHEEQLQKQSAYPNFNAHKAFHELYKLKLKNIATQATAHETTVTDLSSLNVHVAVLVSHIRIEDKRLGAFLHNK